MPRLYAALIRHAEYRQLADTPSAHQPFPLTEAGMVQAKGLAGELRRFCDEHSIGIHSVVDSSHILRAWQTAEILNADFRQHENRSCKIESFEELAERSVGTSVANLTIQQIEQVLQQDQRYIPPPADWKSDSHYCLPFAGAESLLMAGGRVARHLMRRMAELSNTVTGDCLKLFIGHGAAFRHAAYHLEVLDFEDIARLSMYHARPIFLQYEGPHDWQHIAGQWKQRDSQALAMD